MTPPERLSQALEHLSRGPGKRIRGQLTISAARCCGGDQAARRASLCAEAVELIHSYSLVHDDLPAMDNDSMRRGQPTLHVAFDEATAILVGDGLQTRAFQLICEDTLLSAQQRVDVIACLAAAAGFEGMVGGQSLDMQATERQLTLEQLQHMHAMKTGALIRAALEIGAIVGEATQEQRTQLITLGECLGLTFQIVDDILDVEGDSQTLGKTQGKDAAENKATYVSLLGIDKARSEAERLHRESLKILEGFGDAAADLHSLVQLVYSRDH